MYRKARGKKEGRARYCWHYTHGDQQESSTSQRRSKQQLITRNPIDRRCHSPPRSFQKAPPPLPCLLDAVGLGGVVHATGTNVLVRMVHASLLTSCCRLQLLYHQRQVFFHPATQYVFAACGRRQTQCLSQRHTCVLGLARHPASMPPLPPAL